MHADKARGGLLRVKNRCRAIARTKKALDGEVESANEDIV
jgi:hypothetical protein